MDWNSVNGGGIIQNTSASFTLSGTIGQPDAGVMAGSSFTMTGGFWFPVQPGDGNGDGVVDLDGCEVFEGCLAGQGGTVSIGE